MLEHQFTQPTKPKRVIILGANGFVSRNLAQELAHRDVDFLTIGSTEIDLTQPASVAQLGATLRQEDALVMTSALTREKGRDITTLMKNLEMARHLAACLEARPCAQVIYLSSDSVYNGGESLIRESSPRQPSDLYSLMHISREQMLSYAAAKSATPLCILCPCAIYGAADTHNSYGPNRFFRSALRDRKITLFGHGEETRDHIYIADIARLLTLCLMHRSAGILNGISGEAVTFYDIAMRIAKQCGPDVQLEFLSRNSPITHRHFDVTERIKAFPSFAATPLDKGLTDMFHRLAKLQ